MPNRKSKSGGQSQGSKQASGGGASRAPKPQAANKPRSVATPHPQTTRNASSKPQTSSGKAAAPSPPQPQATAHRPPNGTKQQNAANGAAKPQGAQGSNFVRVSGHGSSQGRSANQGTPKRNGGGLNNGPQQVQGHSARPNVSLKTEASKPKPSQGSFGGHSSASNPALPSSPRPGNVQHSHVPKAHGAATAGNRVFPDSSPTSKQSGHAKPHAQKAQNHAPTPPKEPTFLPAPPARQQSGKNTRNSLPKVQVATTHAQQPSRGGQLSSPAAQGFAKPSHQSQQQHKAPPHSRFMQETSSKGHKDTPSKPSTNKRDPPKESVLSSVFSFFSAGSKTSGNPSHKAQHAQQSKTALPHSRPAQETFNNGHKNTPSKTPMNNRGQGQPPAKSAWPKVPSSPPSTKKGKPSTESVTPSVFSLSSTESKGSGNTSHKSQPVQQHRAPPSSGYLAVLSRAVDRSPMSSKPQTDAAHHLKQFQVRSSSSKVLSQRDPSKKAAVRKGLLRQRTRTLTWRESDTPRSASAYSTLTAAPLPSPPKNELQNKVARETISQNPELFKVVSPIKPDVFKEYVKDHPNQPFVQSVARALKKGFWPWADTSDPSFPTTHDGSRQGSRITSEDKAKFIRQQSEEEMELERWSKPFGDKSLPGMHSAPVHVVPKSTPGKFRLIVDQSRGPHALNSTIPKSQVKVQLDNIHDLGNELLAARKKYPNRKLVLFKSDVKSAYRQLPMHPLWQIKQAIPIDGQYHIDRCNSFGNRSSGWNWDSVQSTVNRIATEKKGVSGLLGYVDDNFGWEFKRNKQFYKPYNKHLPTKQAALLELWDELGIPHDEEKQLSGPALPILGYHVDAEKMTVKVPDEKKAKVVDLLRSNAHAGKSYTVNQLESVAGSVGSALSLYPRLRPGLRVLFDEMSRQEPGTTKLEVTKPVARCLSSLADFLEHAPPVPIRYQKEKVRRIGT